MARTLLLQVRGGPSTRVGRIAATEVGASMEKMTKVNELARDTRGANTVEKLILIGLVALAVFGGFRYFGSAVRQKVLDQAVTVRDAL